MKILKKKSAEPLQHEGSRHAAAATTAADRRATDTVILYTVKKCCLNKGQRPKTL